MRGVTTLIAFIILVAITLTIAAMINPWLFRSIIGETDDISNESDTQFICRNVQYAFMRAYGTDGMDLSLCTSPRYLKAKIKNFGSIDLYGFSFTLVFNDSETTIPVTPETQITESDPLRPQEETILEGIPTECTETPNEIKITNGLGCPPLVYSI